MFDKLTKKNFEMYSMKMYINPHCEDIEEFYEDMNRNIKQFIWIRGLL
mgnify:CR=1 FL=1